MSLEIRSSPALEPRAPPGRASKRKYISKACDECRRRKSKCDGKRPECSRCTMRKVGCSYAAEDDGRHPASRRYVELLRRRIKYLEGLLRSQSDADIPAVRRALVSGHQVSTGASRMEDDLKSSGSEDICNSFEGALCLDESLNFDADGQPRYFGATSGRLEFEPFVPNAGRNAPPGANSVQSSDRRRFHCLFQELELETNRQLSETLESHLIELYFEWQHPWMQVIDEKLFRDSRRTDGKYYSPLLLNCILAFASRLCNRLEVRSDPDDPNTAGKLFLEKAEALLPFDLKWPSITTIQALSILGTFYVATGSDAAGWLHHGMASRLALDMGFNHDPARFVRSLTPEEIELRRQIYWSLYCHDKLFASYTGRVCTMLYSQGRVILPSLTDISAREQGNLEPDLSPRFGNPQLVMLHRALITQCQIFEKILLMLYSPKPLLEETQRTTFCNSCILELKTWFYDLPAELRIDRPRTDILPQPFLSAGVEAGSLRPESPGNTKGHAGKTPLDVCYEAVKQLCVVSRKYRQKFGSFQKSPITATHCTLSAALFLLKKMKLDTGEPKARDCNLFTSCLKTLEELGTAWYPARRYWNNLSCTYVVLFDRDGYSETSGSDSSTHSGLALDMEFQQNLGLSEDMNWTVNLPEHLNWTVDEQGYSDNLEIMADLSSWSEIETTFMFDSLPDDYTHFDTLN